MMGGGGGKYLTGVGCGIFYGKKFLSPNYIEEKKLKRNMKKKKNGKR